jgi:autotransporter-associated beta strand protein
MLEFGVGLSVHGVGFFSVGPARPTRLRIRAALLASSVLMGTGPALAVDATWNAAGTGDYNTAANWTPATVPDGTATFGLSAQNAVTMSSASSVGGWTFGIGASAYTFGLTDDLTFNGAGIVINGGSVTIANNLGVLRFTNSSTAGSATIANNNGSILQFNNTSTAGSATITNNSGTNLQFLNGSTAGSAAITNDSFVNFVDTSTAGSANITNNNSHAVRFFNSSTAGSATITNNGNLQFFNGSTAGNAAITNGASGATDFSSSTGPLADNKLSAGSLNGGGNFRLGQNELTVGGNNLSTNVTGVIADGGSGGGTGAKLIKTGTGTMILSGTNTYTGGTTISGGTLTVNGSTAASALTTVNAGGTLMGTGTVGNTLVTGGTFAPGSGTAGSAITVNGTLGFNAASTYAVNVNPTTASSATVTGAATLGGATVNSIFANGSYLSKQYTILTAGSISGTFGTLTNTNLPTNFSDTLSYDATHAYLNLSLSFQQPGGFNGNQQAVANALINFFNTTGGIPGVFGTLNGNGLSQAAGQPGAATAQTGIGGVGQFVNAVFDAAFDDNSGQGAARFAADDQANAYASEKKVAADAANAFAKAMPVKAVAPSFTSRWAVWATAYGGNNRVNGDAVAGSSTTTSRLFGAVAGAGYRMTPNTQLGFALGAAGSNFNLDGGFGGGRADIFNAAVYAKHTMGAAYLAGLLGYSWQDTTTDRTVTIAGTDQLRANFKAQALTARLEGGWRYATPVVGVTPYAALQSTSFFLPGYGETATSGSSTFALNYASKTVTATRGELGAKFDKAMLVRDGLFTLKAKAAWAHDWNTDRAATATFQALPGATFTVNGAQPSANAALASLGAEMKWHNGWSLAGSFDGEFSRTTAGYAGKGSVRYAW